ncbi:cyclin-dependent kinase inhibitor 5-like [Andrographis paniculata]|uniref:cyclin-dependent kinase inhibitor 5-like n=1 Tax=Andrographis paniculata TaxID=175694 RepID=UPI0021E781A4|nr:cyclin-dependent kinase inhibitor 5-like [Andrographis paniculata]
MGKFTRKAKVTMDVAVMDASRSALGVRTRAKAALQGRQQPPPDGEVCYLELRSRRLEKRMQRKNSRNVRRGCGYGSKVEIGGQEVCFMSAVGAAEGFGGTVNDLDSDARERNTRESTPCNLIKPVSPIAPLGSTTPNQRVENVHLPNVPPALELEEFFSREEQLLQQRFKDKYNFDIINDLPLPGRYEWVAVEPSMISE